MKYAVIIVTLFAVSCTHNKVKPNLDDVYVDPQAVEESKAKFYESLKWDTVGMTQSGIIVTDARFVREEYSRFKTVRIRYKNVSGKKIRAIKFKWHGTDAFGDPADCGGYDPGFGGGITDDPISNGSTETKYWDVLSNNGDKITMAWPTEVAFADGTKWESTYKMSH